MSAYEEAVAKATRWCEDADNLAANGIYLGAQASAAVGQAFATLALVLRPCSPWCRAPGGYDDYIPSDVPPF